MTDSTTNLTARDLDIIKASLQAFANTAEAEAARLKKQKRPRQINIDGAQMLAREARGVLAKLS
jgi:hypothetical protein